MSERLDPLQGFPQASIVTPRTVIAVGAVLPSVAAVFVALRLYVRFSRKSSVGLDDCLIVFSSTITLAIGLMMIVGSAEHALAQPTPLGDGPTGFMTVLNKAIVTTEKMKWAFNLLQILVLGTVKLSVVLFYRRIFRGRVFDLYSKLLIAIVSAWTIAFFFAILFECGTNHKYLWSTLLDLLTHCYDDIKCLKGYAISDLITDGLILVTPIPIIWRLQMSIERRIGICAAFLLGTVAVAASLARVIIFVTQLNNGFSKSQGILIISTWMYWSMIELGLSIVAACLPTLRPLFGRSSIESWRKSIRSYFTLHLKPFSNRGDGSGSGYTSRANENYKPLEERAWNSKTRINVPDQSAMAQNIYAMQDLESQTEIPKSHIVVQNRIEQTWQKK